MAMNSFGNKNFMQPMGRLSMCSKCLDFFSFKFGGGAVGEGFFFFLPLFPTCSFQVPIRFPICSPRVSPTAPRFNPICFAQSPPLLTYIGGQKGEALHLSREFLFLGRLCSFNFFLQWGNQIGSLQKKKKKSWICENNFRTCVC
jgi:hypothetical protein